MVARFLQGLGAGAGVPVGTTLIAQAITPSGRSRALGFFGAGDGRRHDRVVAHLAVHPAGWRVSGRLPGHGGLLGAGGRRRRVAAGGERRAAAHGRHAAAARRRLRAVGDGAQSRRAADSTHEPCRPGRGRRPADVDAGAPAGPRRFESGGGCLPHGRRRHRHPHRQSSWGHGADQMGQGAHPCRDAGHVLPLDGRHSPGNGPHSDFAVVAVDGFCCSNAAAAAGFDPGRGRPPGAGGRRLRPHGSADLRRVPAVAMVLRRLAGRSRSGGRPVRVSRWLPYAGKPRPGGDVGSRRALADAPSRAGLPQINRRCRPIGLRPAGERLHARSAWTVR